MRNKFSIKYILKITGYSFLLLLILLSIAFGVVYFKKDAIIQYAIKHANEDFQGMILAKKVNITPFQNFPYVSIVLNELKVYETKKTDTLAVIDIEKAYLGFDFWKLIENDFQIKKISLENGFINIIQYPDGSLNINHCFQPIEEEKEEDISSPFTIDLQNISLKQIDITKNNIQTNILVEADVNQADISFKKTTDWIKLRLDGAFVLNIFNQMQPTYVYHKNMELHTDFEFHKETHMINFKKSTVVLEGSDFDMSGTIDVDNEMSVDLKFSGRKPNFDMLIAFAPESLIPTLKSYDNRGQVFFDAHIKGKTANNQPPSIQANFGCKDGYIKNKEEGKILDQLGFYCSFTNGAERSNKTSVFELKDFNARPEAGIFKARIKIVNLDSPEIDMRLDSDFDLEFLSKFFKLEKLKNLTGKVLLSMNFHDIIDLQNPEKALEKFNQAYFTKLDIQNLNFKSDSYHLPISNLNIQATITGQDLEVKNISLNIGESDIAINGKVSNIPDVIHKTNALVKAELHIKSKLLQLEKLLSKSNESSIDEEISNFHLDFYFKGKANTFITSKSLPVGNYYLTNINAQLKNYKHLLHHFNGIFYINEEDILIKRFDGILDTSDFHFEGKVSHYDLWLSDKKNGKTSIDFDLKSNEIHFAEIFSYKSKNFMPEEYQKEDIKELNLKGSVVLNYKNNVLKSTDFYLKNLDAKLNLHPLKLHGFYGNVHLENDILTIREFYGNLGNNDFKIKGIYHTSNKKAKNKLHFSSNRFDINEVITYTPPTSSEKIDHNAGKNIFKEPFPNLILTTKINDLKYQNYHATNIQGQMEIKENHYVLLNQLRFQTAGGLLDISGYFDGSNPNKIYLNPDFKVQKLDLEKILLKFDNFGQDQLISDNLQGKITGRITGKILLHADLTPVIRNSRLQMDLRIEDGSLNNFAPMQAMADYFGNKNLNRVRFDVLENRFSLSNGNLSFPNMNINSTLGYIEISGSQSIDKQMDYYVRVPLKLVGKAAFNKLFRRRPNEISPEQEDELIIRDPTRRTRFINIRLHGKPDNYRISLQKNRDIRAGISFQRTDDFLFDDLESELEDN